MPCEGSDGVGYDRTRNIKVDVPALKEKYAGLDCPHVVELIDYLNSEGRNLLEIGVSISPDGMSGELTLVSPRMRIGSVRGNVSPLQWLAYVSELPGALPEKMQAFDLFCGALLIDAPEIDRGDVF